MSATRVAAERRSSSVIAPRAGESARMLPSVIGGPCGCLDFDAIGGV